MQFPGVICDDMFTVLLTSLLHDWRTPKSVDERREDLAQYDHGHDIATSATLISLCVA